MHTYDEFNSNKLKCRDCSVGQVYNCVVPSVGNKINPTYMLIGEAPGRDEVEKGQPFCGKSGKLLRIYLSKYKLNKDNTIITNTIPCRPSDNIFPVDSILINNCVEKWLKKEIEILKPKYILLIGSNATHYVLGKTDSISKIRGQQFFKNGICYIPTFHPSYVLRNQHIGGKHIENAFEEDIKKLSELGGQVVDTALLF